MQVLALYTCSLGRRWALDRMPKPCTSLGYNNLCHVGLPWAESRHQATDRRPARALEGEEGEAEAEAQEAVSSRAARELPTATWGKRVVAAGLVAAARVGLGVAVQALMVAMTRARTTARTKAPPRRRMTLRVATPTRRMAATTVVAPTWTNPPARACSGMPARSSTAVPQVWMGSQELPRLPRRIQPW